MKSIFLSLALLLGATMLRSNLYAAQASSSAPSAQSPQAMPSNALSAQGEISRVDSQKQIFWIHQADNTEMQFSYTKDTPVTGASGSIEGLSDMNGRGSQVKIEYEDKGGAHVATKIEIQPATS